MKPIKRDPTKVDYYQRLNSITKFPSIPTYHVRGSKGKLTDQINAIHGIFPGDAVYVSEKVDGTNIRIIVDERGHVVVGSREEIIYADGCTIERGSYRVIEAFERLGIGVAPAPRGTLTVFYGELYGWKIQNWKAYVDNPDQAGFVLFGRRTIGVEMVSPDSGFAPEEVAARREAWVPGWSPVLLDVGQKPVGIEGAVPAPVWEAVAPPEDPGEAMEWLQDQLARATVAERDPEGVVIHLRKGAGRQSRPAKLRIKDYERAVRGRKQ